MAQVINANTNQIKTNDGKVIVAQQGGWYDGQQYWGGTLSAKGVINSQSNQQGAGQAVSAEVNAQSAAAQGKSNQEFANYLNKPTGNAVPQGGGGGGYLPDGSSAGGGGGLGIPAAPSIDIQSIYDTSFKTPEITAATAAIAAKQAEIEDKKRLLAEAEAGISDNPYYSEATRVGKISKLREKANKDIENLNGEYANLVNSLNTLRGDAQTKVDLALKQYDINSNEYQMGLQKLNTLVSLGALSGASSEDLAQLSQQTGISTSMLQSVVKKANQTEPYLTTVQDGNGNYTILAIDKNTGNVINKQTVPGVGNAEGGSGGKATTQDYADILKQDARAGKTLSQIFSVYSGYLDPDLIYQLYNSNSKYGPDKGSITNLAKYGVTQPAKSATNNQNPFLQ